MSERIGQQFGNYRLERLLGEGSFAQVYLGIQIYLDTEAAIKVLRTQLETDELDLFRKEARTVARLSHPNIIRVLDFGVENATPYIVLELAPNGTLRKRVRRGTILPLPTVAFYIKQVAAALQYAHEQRVIHRDVKPENMLLGRNDEVLLGDFGVALMAQSTRNQSLQDIAGTIPYIAPEAIQGRPVPASDQYSLAIVAYEWISGKRPFDGSTTEVIAQHLSVPPRPLRELLPNLPAAIDEVLARALAKEGDKRFPTIRDFALALEQVALANPPLAPAPPVSPSEAPAPRVVPNPPSNPAGNASIAPASSLSSKRASGPPIGTIVASYREHATTVRTLAWSPEGQLIMSAGDEKRVYVWDPRTGTTITSYQDASDAVRIITLSPNGLRTATAGSDAIVRVWNRQTNAMMQSYRGHGGSAMNTAAWLPAPQMQVLATGGDDGTAQVWESDTGKLYCTYSLHEGSVNTLAWSPNAQRMASGGSDAAVHIWEARTAKNLLINSSQPGQILSVAWSPDGRLVAVGRDNGGLQWWDVAANSEVRNFSHNAPVTVVAWSPDGQRFAFADAAGSVLLYSTASNKRLYTFIHGSPVRAMAWSPDGTSIASGGEDKLIYIWKSVI